MLTPVEIQNKTFKSGGLGYDKREVEAFMRDISRNYEELYRQNMELKDKVSVLNEGIQYYKTIEKTLQKALVLAEKTAEETKAAAQKDAKRIEKEANVKAKIILADAKNELNTLHAQTVALIEQYEKYKLQFKNLARTQMELLESDAFSINVQRLDAFISNSNKDDEAEEKPVTDSKADENKGIQEIISEENTEAAKVTEVAESDQEEYLIDYSEEDFEEANDSVNNSQDSLDKLDDSDN